MTDQTFEITPINDNPVNNATLLGHREIVQTLKNFIESEHMISASSIAIHGDWGTGKTSIMKTLEKKLVQGKVEVLFFEAWKYEYTNPSLGLVSELSKYLGDAQKAKMLIEIAAFIFVEKLSGLPLKDIVSRMRSDSGKPINFTKQIEEIVKKIGKRLVIIIDDLDRCDIENSLQILSLMKLFLSIENCVCIAAVDFNRLQQAWKMKYQVKVEGVETKKDESRDYLDKIFQIRIAIPVPPEDRIQEYYRNITKEMPNELLTIFSKFGPSNPRAIKRLLNLISYRTFLLDNESTKLYSASLWSILENYLSNQTLIYLQDRLQTKGANLSKFSYYNSMADVENDLNGVLPRKILDKIDLQKMKIYHELSKSLLKKLEITEQDFSKDLALLYTNTKEPTS